MTLGDLVLAYYLGGLAIECILQAIALRQDPSHDSRHDLRRWLGRCPVGLQQALASERMRTHWTTVATDWNNSLRYFSESALLGYLRKKKRLRRWKGDTQARMNQAVTTFVNASERVFEKGVAQWLADDRS